MTFDGLAEECYLAVEKLRNRPRSFARGLKKLIENFKGFGLYHRSGFVPVSVTEGKEGLLSLISELYETAPLVEVSRCVGLFYASQYIARMLSEGIPIESIPTLKIISEYGSWYGGVYLLIDEGSVSGVEAVMSLLLDDGLVEKTNKQALLNNFLKHIGVGAAPSQKNSTIVVILLATDYLSYEKSPNTNAFPITKPIPKPVEIDEWVENAQKLECEITHRDIGEKRTTKIIQTWTLFDENLLKSEKIIET